MNTSSEPAWAPLEIELEQTGRTETERKKNRLSTMVSPSDISGCLLILLDASGTIADLNALAERYFHRDRDDVRGKSFLRELVDPDKRARIAALLERTVSGARVPGCQMNLAVDSAERRAIVWSFDLFATIESGRADLLVVGQDITKFARLEEESRDARGQLKDVQQALTEKEVALQEVLGHLEAERQRWAREIRSNIERVILPVVRLLSVEADPARDRLLAVLQNNLRDLASPEISGMETHSSNLSPREIEVCNLIQNGLTSKEIAVTLHSSPETVRSQRKSIRRKLGIAKSTQSLSSFLSSS